MIDVHQIQYSGLYIAAATSLINESIPLIFCQLFFNFRGDYNFNNIFTYYTLYIEHPRLSQIEQLVMLLTLVIACACIVC